MSVVVSGQHTHLPDETNEEVLEMRKNLKRNIIEEAGLTHVTNFLMTASQLRVVASFFSESTFFPSLFSLISFFLLFTS